MANTDPTGYLSIPPDLIRGCSWKQPCRVATTASITISTALNNGDSIDGVTLATGDRVLVKDQGTGSQNGIYVVGVTPTRAFDMDQDLTTAVPAEETLGAAVYVIAGTVNGGTFWRTTNTTVPTLGTTAIAWAQFGAAAPSFATPGIVLGTAAGAGAAATVIRSDATIVAFDATVPVTEALGDAAATGSAAVAARRDHRHGMPALSTAMPLVESGVGAVGTAAPSSREDHVHPAAAAAAGSDHQHIGDLQFSGDGATTDFELPAAPFDAYSVQAYVAGVRLDVTLSGTLLTTMTFGSAPAAGTNNILVDLIAIAA